MTLRFTTGPEADLVYPRVLTVTPASGAVGVPVNAVVEVEFSERVNPLTVRDTTFHVLSYFLGQRVDGRLEVLAGGTRVRFVPDTPLSPSTYYQISVVGVTDLVGLPLSPSSVAVFTTGYGGTDTEAPFVLGVSPADGAVGVGTNARVMVRLSEPLSGASVGSGDLQVVAGGVAVLGTMSLSPDGRDVSFVPTASLVAGLEHQVSLSGVEDLAGNGVVPFVSRFTVGTSSDTVGPTVEFSPAGGASEVALDADVVATFSEAVSPPTVNEGSVYLLLDGATQVAAGLTLESAGQVARLRPVGGLLASRTYTVVVLGVTDYSGNGSGFGTSTFTTGTGPADATSPEVVSVLPADGTEGVGPQAEVVLTFSESLDPGTVNGDGFGILVDGVYRGVGVSRSSDGRTVRLASGSLPESSWVTVVATSAVKDLSGNALHDFVSEFRTGSFTADRTGPQIVGQRPGSGTREVDGSTSIVLYANEPLAVSTVEAGMFVAQDGVLVSGALRVGGNGRVIEFVPSSPLRTGSLIEVFAMSLVEDVSGNPLYAYSGSFRVAEDARVQAPRVVRTSAASAVPLNAVFDVELSEALDATTVDATTVSLANYSTGQPVAATVSLRGGGRVLRLQPQPALAASTSYSVYLETGIRDLDGQSLPSRYSVSFSTGTQSDTVAPTAVTLSPPEGAVGVGLNASLWVSFDEAVNPLTVNEQTVRLGDGVSLAPVYSVMFQAGDRGVELLPHAPLAASRTYTLRVEGVEDLAGNAVVVREVRFQTGSEPDTVSPKLVRTSPIGGAGDVPVNAVVEAEFDETLDPATLEGVQLTDYHTGQPIAGSRSLGASGRVVSFVPSSPLPVGRLHNLRVSGVRDLSGNAATTTSDTFTTSFVPDMVGPRVVGSSPVDGTQEVPTNVVVTVQFDEPVSVLSVDAVTLHDGAGQLVAVKRTLEDSGRRLTLTVPKVLRTLSDYRVVLTGVKDLGGNPLQTPADITFQTGNGPDLVYPRVLTVTPASGAVGVPVNAVVEVEFSERVNPLTVRDTTFHVLGYFLGQRVDGRLEVLAGGTRVRFVPDTPLSPSTYYQISVVGVTDLVGLPLSPSSSSVFTTGN